MSPDDLTALAIERICVMLLRHPDAHPLRWPPTLDEIRTDIAKGMSPHAGWPPVEEDGPATRCRQYLSIPV